MGPDPDLASIAEWMRRDWDQRATTDPQYHVYTRDSEADEADFDESGKVNYRQLVQPYLSVLLGGRSASTCRVLEIGCGVGRMTRWLARDFGEVDALDVSPEMIERARERLAGCSNVRLHTGSGYDLQPLPDASFDLVFSYIVFQHIPSRPVIANYVREAARVLRPGGWFKFQLQGGQAAEYRERPRDTWLGETFSPDEASAMLAAAGFSLMATEGAGTQYFLLTARKGPAFDFPPPYSLLFPGEEWASPQLLEGWYDPVGASWRCIRARSKTMLAAPRGERLRLAVALYFRREDPWTPREMRFTLDDAPVAEVRIAEGADHEFEFPLPASATGRVVRLVIEIDPPPDPSLGPAVRCVGIFAKR